MALGSLWFSALFGKRWTALRVGPPMSGTASPLLYVITGVVRWSARSHSTGSSVSPALLYAIVAGYPIVGLLLMGAIIGALGA